MATENNGFMKGLILKLIGHLVLAGIVFGLSTKAGFPVLFTWIFLIYVLASFIFYIVLDLPDMKKQTPGGGAIGAVVLILILSACYTAVGYILPQFDPQYEIDKINEPPLVLPEAGPELIAAGREVFSEYKCFNCHKADGEGTSLRGPSFDLWQIGLTDRARLLEDIVDPKKNVSFGFEDKKSMKAMPTYFGEDISDDEMEALLAFLSSLKNETTMPIRGKEDGTLLRWDEDPEILEMAKKAYEGELFPPLNCSVCHGKDGTPLMGPARDFRNPEAINKNNNNIPLKEWTDADWYKSVAMGVPNTPMLAWGVTSSPKAIWMAIAYSKQFSKPYISGEKQYK